LLERVFGINYRERVRIIALIGLLERVFEINYRERVRIIGLLERYDIYNRKFKRPNMFTARFRSASKPPSNAKNKSDTIF
jgi:hypothetical protein